MGTRKLLAATLLLIPIALHAQLTLESCRQKAHDNYPAVKQYDLLDKSREYTLDNANKAWLPQVSATGYAMAMTDMLAEGRQPQALGMDTKNLGAAATVSVSQRIYDGGQTAAGKAVTKAETEVARASLGVTLYAINDRIEQLYFGILLIDEQLRQNQLLYDDLSINERQVADMIKGGVANSSDLEAVKVEKVRCRQSEVALTASRQSYVRMLGHFIGEQLADTVSLQPGGAEAGGGSMARPELRWYDARLSLLDEQRHQLDTRLRPTVGAFGMGLVHTRLATPNMLHDSFFAVGLSLSWNIGALYTRKNDLRKLRNEAGRIQAERETFLFDNRLQSDDTQGRIDGLRRQIALDEEAVALRRSIYAKSMKKVRLGTETVNEMLRDAIAVSQAAQQQSLHRIQLQQAICQQKTILGL